MPPDFKPGAFIIDGMFIIYTSPAPGHHTFGQYALYLYNRWVTHIFGDETKRDVSEVHICFDRQKDDIPSPKVIERQRRDAEKPSNSKVYDLIENTTLLPYKWSDFLAVRENKHRLIEYIQRFFMRSAEHSLRLNTALVISDGITPCTVRRTINETGKIQSMCITDTKYIANHVEADTLVFLHSVLSERSDCLIYSPDTDVFNIGMPLVERFPQKHFVIQLKDTSQSQHFIDLDLLLNAFSNDTDLSHLVEHNIGAQMQTLFISSGCDYVSHFKHKTKNNFYSAFLDNCSFVSCNPQIDGNLSQTFVSDWESGFLSFCRLIGCVFLQKCAKSFVRCVANMSKTRNPTADEIFRYFVVNNSDKTPIEIHRIWLDEIREASMKVKNNTLQEYHIPSMDSLKLHWRRTCYISQIWNQAFNQFIKYPCLTEWGWSYVKQGEENVLVCKWDSESNLAQIQQFRKLWLEGCHCVSVKNRCGQNRCSCFKSSKPCGPACECGRQCLNRPQDPSIDALIRARNPNVNSTYRDVDDLNADGCDIENEYAEVEDIIVLDIDSIETPITDDELDSDMESESEYVYLDSDVEVQCVS